MTSTSLASSVTVGSTGAYGTNASRTTLQTTTTALCINVRLTNGAAAGNLNKSVRVYVATSEFSITAAAAVEALKRQAFYMDVRPHETPGAVTIQCTGMLPRQGQYCFVWTEEPTFTVASTLDLYLVELP